MARLIGNDLKLSAACASLACMSSPSVVAKATGLRDTISRGDAGLAILRAQLMPVIVAVLSERLGGLVRQLPAAEFTRLVADDLDELRLRGFDLPRSAGDYVAEWVRLGILVRDNSGRDETVELSPSAQVAIRFVAGIDTHGRSVTRSRLANVADLLAKLARDTDTEQEGRLAALRAEQAEIERQIAQVEAGEYTPVDAKEARERLDEVLRLASEIPGDFAQVSADLRGINAGLREKIINSVGSRGDVLDAVFAGVDLIDESDAGRSFGAFNALLADQQRSQELDDSITQVLSRDGLASSDDPGRAFLVDFMATLESESAHVRSTMTGFSRSLRSFVQNRAYEEHRVLRDALARAQADVLEAVKHVKLTTHLTYGLPSTSVVLATVGTWRLYNPADVRVAAPVVVQRVGTLDIEALRARVRLSEIDFAELRRSVADVISRRGPSSIGEVLGDYPATQGLASVVGLLTLAVSMGHQQDGTERLSWRSDKGVTRGVIANRFVFMDVPGSWSGRPKERSK